MSETRESIRGNLFEEGIVEEQARKLISRSRRSGELKKGELGVLTYHQIKGLMEKVNVLAGQVGCLRESINSVIEFSDAIDSLNADLMCERERISHEIRSVEVLEQILQKYVYSDSGAVEPTGASSAEFICDNVKEKRPTSL